MRSARSSGTMERQKEKGSCESEKGMCVFGKRELCWATPAGSNKVYTCSPLTGMNKKCKR